MKKVVSCFEILLMGRLGLGWLGVAIFMALGCSGAYADAYEMGLQLYAKGNYAMASRYFLEAAGQTQDNPNAHYYLADSYLKMNRLAEAQAEYQKILAIAPNTPAAKLSQMALAQLRTYMSANRSDRWRQASGNGRVLADKYNGPPPTGADYLDEVTEGGRYVRWSLSKMPLKVYIESTPQNIRNFQPAFVYQVRRALEIWVGALNHQLSFEPVSSPEAADIRVTWTNTIDTRGRSGDGGTAYTAGLMIPRIKDDQIEHMNVKIATFDIKGNPQSADTIYAVAIHELGHSLGLLGHSTNEGDLMYAENQQVIALSARDLATIRRLYSLTADISNLPPGNQEQNIERETLVAQRMDETITKLEASAKNDGMALTFLNLGVAYFQKGKQVEKSGEPERDAWFKKSLEAIGKAIQMEPKDPRAYHKRSLTYQELADFPKALQDIRMAISLDRREPEYYMLQSWFLARLGQIAEARSSLDTYLLYKPGEANSNDVQQIREFLTKSAKEG